MKAKTKAKPSSKTTTKATAKKAAPKKATTKKTTKAVSAKTAKTKAKATTKAKPKTKAKTKTKSRTRKKDSINMALLKKARHFRNLGHKRVGMIFSGGPAPGTNAVISTAAIQFLNANYDVIGFYKGYEFLEQFDRNNPKKLVEGVHYKSLGYDDVTKIRQRGGCILRTARAHPSRIGDKEIETLKDLVNPKMARKLYNVLDAMEYVGVSSLISIGGDGTLKTAYYLSLLGVPVVHVPKTIDNDYYGIPWTFGYFSAIEQARQDLQTYNIEVRTTECYFVIETMGHKAGWYTLGAGIAGEAIRMIGPEEIQGELDLDALIDDLCQLVMKRKALGKPYGVIMVSEGLVDKLPKSKKPKKLDAHGNVRLSSAKIGKTIAEMLKERYTQTTGKSLTVKNETIGYTTRCVEPNAFDVLLGSQLGMGAFQLIDSGSFGNMVSVGDNLEIKKVPFTKLIDPETFKTAIRFVPLDGDFFKLAQSLEFRALTKDGE